MHVLRSSKQLAGQCEINARMPPHDFSHTGLTSLLKSLHLWVKCHHHPLPVGNEPMAQGLRFHGEPTARQPYHKPHTSLGATGHWVREAGILAPLIISEFVKDGETRWRYIRMASIATALFSQGLWTAKIHKERQTAREGELFCQNIR